MNAGQICIAPDYVLVHSDVASEFKSKLVSKLKKWYGDSAEERKSCKDYGKIINSRHVGRIYNLVDETTGKILMGGEADQHARFVDPTVIDEPGMNDSVLREEIFGPVLPIVTVSGVQEAIKRVNNICDHPLALYIYAEDQATIDTFLNGTTSGGVCVNSCIEHIGNSALPFGGVGESGMGAYHGKAGFDEFTHRRSVLVKDTFFIKGALLPGPPYSDKLYDIAYKIQISGLITDKQRKLLKLAGVTTAALIGYRVVRSRL
uniref:Aldehyde dehydrogenase domain-containing protein n=1 Tax=Aplanochytrium stocchinoi TaxID=215587 RepID=A0A7S3PFX9_9STRA